MQRVIDIIRREKNRTPVVVLSAVAGATNTLLKAAHIAGDGNLEEAILLLNQLLERHVSIAENLIDDRPTIQEIIFACRRKIEELRNLCHGIALLRELTNRSLDSIASVGELLSSLILSKAMRLGGLNVELVDARKFMMTDEHFVAATPLLDQINERATAVLSPFISAGTIVVTQGFIGSTTKGITSTLGRGGSDYSASILGAALDAEEIQIWTDVDGLMTADPQIAPLAQKINVISFREASELAYFGAKVLHPSTILPAVTKNIPVIVLNSKRPNSSGTRIVPNPPRSSVVVKSVAAKKGITVINIQSSRMLMAYGFLESMFGVFSKHKTPVDLVSTSEVAVSLSIDMTDELGEIVEELEHFAEVSVFEKKAILCIVGDRMHTTAGVAHRIFRALGDINAIMISQGASENNMSLVIDESEVTRAVQSLHKEFFEPMPAGDIFEPVGSA